MSSITMLNEIIRGKVMSCCFPWMRKFVTRKPCNAARGWAGSCAITIKKPRDFSTGRRDQMGLAMRPIKSGPLSNREIKELDAFLLADDSLENARDVSTLDGFLCAVVAGPKIVMPSEWMRWIWDMDEGEQSPEFASENQAQRILSLLEHLPKRLNRGVPLRERIGFKVRTGMEASMDGETVFGGSAWARCWCGARWRYHPGNCGATWSEYQLCRALP